MARRARSTRRRPGGGLARFYGRVALVGFWGLLVGGVATFVAATLLPAGGERAGDSNVPVAGMSLAPIVLAGLGGLLDAGLASMCVGVVLLALGARLATAATERLPRVIRTYLCPHFAGAHMPGLGERTGTSTDVRSELLLGTGLGLLLAGAVAVAFGLVDLLPPTLSEVGVPRHTATRVALVVAGAIPSIALGAAGFGFATRRGRLARRVGGALVGVALVGAWWLSGPGAASVSALPTPVWGAYLSGLLVLFFGTVATGLDATEAGSRTSSASVNFQRETTDRVTPADGGEEQDAELYFPLDDDED